MLLHRPLQKASRVAGSHRVERRTLRRHEIHPKRPFPVFVELALDIRPAPHAVKAGSLELDIRLATVIDETRMRFLDGLELPVQPRRFLPKDFEIPLEEIVLDCQGNRHSSPRDVGRQFHTPSGGKRLTAGT